MGWGWGHMLRERCGDENSSDGDRVGIGTEAVGMGWGWVLCSRGWAGMGFSFCPRADL